MVFCSPVTTSLGCWYASLLDCLDLILLATLDPTASLSVVHPPPHVLSSGGSSTVDRLGVGGSGVADNSASSSRAHGGRASLAPTISVGGAPLAPAQTTHFQPPMVTFQAHQQQQSSGFPQNQTQQEYGAFGLIQPSQQFPPHHFG